MTPHPQDLPTIAYATSAGDDAEVPRALRRMAGWTAAIYGTGGALARAYFIAMSRKWFPAPVDFGQFPAVQDAIEWLGVAASVALCAAGVLVLRRTPGAVVALRVAAACVLLAMYAHQLYDTLQPRGMFALRGYSVLTTVGVSSVLPALLIVLTLGPLGRALRRA